MAPYNQDVDIRIAPHPCPTPRPSWGPTTTHVAARGNRLRLVLNDATRFTTPGDVLTPNAWNHVAASFDGTTMRLYVNGAQAARSPRRARPPKRRQAFEIGHRPVARGWICAP